MLCKLACTAQAIKYSDAAGHRENFPLVLGQESMVVTGRMSNAIKA